ncbi:MAG: hypothetical protein PVF43_15500, partial [Candidatus Eiseniibacteriota bacterium]
MHLRTTSCRLILLAVAGMLGTWATAPALAQGIPGDGARQLTPVIAVDPTSLDFGTCVEVGSCADLVIAISNGNSDPGSELVIEDIAFTGSAFAFPNPPILPATLTGGGPALNLTVRFCPTDAIQYDEVMSILAGPETLPPNPLEVPLTGTGRLAPVCDAGGPYFGDVGEEIAFDGSGSRLTRLSDD